MPPRRNNPWRDLAETIKAQVEDAVAQSRRNGRSGWSGGSGSSQGPGKPHQDRSSPYLRWDQQPDDGHPDRQDDSSAPADRHRPQPARINRSDLSDQLRGLLSETLGATTETIKQRREERKRSEPIRKARGRSMRSRVAAGAFGVLALVGAGTAAGQFAGEDVPEAVLASVVTVGAGGLSARSGLRARRYTRLADQYEDRLDSPTDIGPAVVGVAPTIRRLPPEPSAAYEPMRRLLAQEQVLAQMLPELQPVAPDVGSIADESERSLEQLAGRIVLLENAVAAASVDTDGDFEELRASLGRMVDRLTDGVAAHERLIANAASVLAEMSGPTPGPTPVSGLRDAADGLQALAIGMREVARPTRHLIDDTPAAPPRSAVDDVPDYGPLRGSTPTRPTEDQHGS